MNSSVGFLSVSPSPRQPVAGSSRRGFTLVELLVVIAIIGILVTVTLSISSGARLRAANERATSELAVLRGGLEDYRRLYRSYPQTSGGAALLSALNGRTGPTGAPMTRAPVMALDAFVLADENPLAAGNTLLDPWNQPYEYRPYQVNGRWAYRLYSIGPDGLDAPPTANGEVDPDFPANLDNLYAHP